MADRQSMWSVREGEVPGFESNEPGFRKIILHFIMHSALAIIGGLAIGSVLVSLVHLRPVGPHWRLITLFADIPHSPAFWGSALLLGLLIGNRIGDRFALWVGPVGVLILALLIALSLPGYKHSPYEMKRSDNSFTKYIGGELFSLDPSKASDEGLGKVLFTTPVLNSVAYSIGAWLGLRSRRTVREVKS